MSGSISKHVRLGSQREELKLFRQLLRLLSNHANLTGRYDEPEAQDIFRTIQDYYPPFGRPEQVAPYIPSQQTPRTDFADTGRWLYLKPSQRPPLFLPVVSLFCDFNRSIPQVRLRVGLFLLQAGELRCVWLRFESPEGEGPHHYYHVQFMKDSSSPVPLEKRLSWLPDSYPAIAIDANGPVGLLLTLVVSLYGLDDASKLAVSLTGLADYWRGMRFTAFTPTYWLVTSGGEQDKYQTWETDDRFRTKARAQHGQHAAISKSDRTTYEANDGLARHTS